MSKKFLLRVLGVGILAVAAVFWLLKELDVAGFEKFNLAWAGFIVTAGWGTLEILSTVFHNDGGVTFKKARIGLAVVLYILAVLCLVFAIAMPKNIVLPLIAVIVAGGLVVSVIVTGGKKWDEADNQKVGYKNYHQRKAEEAKAAEKEKKDGE